MTNVSGVHFEQNALAYINQAVQFHDVVNVSTSSGNAVILSEDEYNSLKETVYLLSIPGMKERLQEALETPLEECEPFEW